MFGLLETAQVERIKALVEGKVVWALGSGYDTQEAWQLVSFGAAKVYAVDKARKTAFEPSFKRLHTGDLGEIWDCGAYFTDFGKWAKDTDLPDPDVVFMKWPRENNQAGLVALMFRAPVVIYVGRNDGVTACGGPDVWEHLRSRELSQVLEGTRNDLLVYGAGGEPSPSPAPRCREEAHAL